MWHGFSHVFLTAVGHRKLHQIWWKSRQFLSKCHGNSMTWPCLKSMSCFRREIKWNLGKWHGIVMEFGVNLDQTAVNIWHVISMRIHVTFLQWSNDLFLQSLSQQNKIPVLICKTCDMDSHGNSMSFHVTNWRQFGSN